jgi:YD repeat-containing protein
MRRVCWRAMPRVERQVDALPTSYTRDSLSRITQLTETGQGTAATLDFIYDSAGRLFEVRRNGALVATYEYDGNGNRLEESDDLRHRRLRRGLPRCQRRRSPASRFAINSRSPTASHDRLRRAAESGVRTPASSSSPSA